MKRYFYKLYKSDITNFQKRVYDRYQSYDKRSVTKFLKAIYDEVNVLFLKIGNRVSEKKDIPKAGEYPDSSSFNKLIYDIEGDLNKLYTANKLIEDDVNNLINFNQIQREKAFADLVSVHQTVYSIYVKSKKDINGGYEVPGGSPFFSSTALSKESDNVFIDENRSVLSLNSIKAEKKPIDIKNINIQILSDTSLQDFKLYPSTTSMRIGSHWKKESDDVHFVDIDNVSTRENYLGMMIDDPNNPVGVGMCEFECCATQEEYEEPSDNATYSMSDNVKKELARKYNRDSALIYVDALNSMQSIYSSKAIDSSLSNISTFKLIIPFIDAAITNQIKIDFMANTKTNGIYPIVDWDKSKIYSNSIAYSFVSIEDTSDNSLKVGKIVGSIIPTRCELILRYSGAIDTIWPRIKFYMSHYVYVQDYIYDLPQDDNSPLKINVHKEFNIFVDSEANTIKEKARALAVLKGVQNGT
jgi:hypothetical protein